MINQPAAADGHGRAAHAAPIINVLTLFATTFPHAMAYPTEVTADMMCIRAMAEERTPSSGRADGAMNPQRFQLRLPRLPTVGHIS